MLSSLTKEIIEQKDRWILFSPVLFGMGVGLYFSLQSEPPLWVASAITAIILTLLVILRHRHAALYPLLTMLMLAGGFLSGNLNSHIHGTKILGKPVEDAVMVGDVVRQELVEGAVRLVLERPHITGVIKEETPRKVRVTLRGEYDDFRPGDVVSLCVSLYPPPLPAYTDEFDAGLAAYFDGIGATGFATCRAEIEEYGKASTFAAVIASVKDSINNRIKEVMASPESTVAMSLITGEQRTVPEEVIENYRKSGTIHILSISGFHIGLLAGLSFWLVRFLLALSPYLALRYPIKKWAAGASLLITLFYLLISGSQVPAVRSFVMVGIIMFAVIVDRKAISVRNIGWAAIIILIFSPESLLSPSFQLSFAATLALVAFYEELASSINSKFSHSRIVFYVAGIVATTLIAGMVTMPIVLHHFNQINNYGLLGNLIAMPLSSFIIMPAAGLSVLLMPFGADLPFLKIMEWGIKLMNQTAAFVGALPGSTVLAPSFTKTGYIAMILGGLWFILWHGKIRLAGMLPVLLGALTILQSSPADIIADSKNALINLGDDKFVLLGRKNTFATKVWMEREGISSALSLKDLKKSPAPDFSCNEDSCILSRNGIKAQIILKKAKGYSVCEGCDLVINQTESRHSRDLAPPKQIEKAICCSISYAKARGGNPELDPRLRGGDEPIIISSEQLERNGTHIIKFPSPTSGRGVISIEDVRTPRGARPWNEY